MGSKNKLKRFAENASFEHVVQPSREELLSGKFPLRGKWREDFFANDNPLVVELGCGKGEYSVNLARKYPEKNFLGIDIKGARFWRGAKTSLAEGLDNVGFLRMQIELLEQAFAPGEIDEIWITFPDPQIKFKRTKHRLTNSAFLNRYRRVLKVGGTVHLKTDSEFLHGYTIGLLQGLGEEIDYAHHDIYGNHLSPEEATSIKTFYEQGYLEAGKKITYLRFRLRSS